MGNSITTTLETGLVQRYHSATEITRKQLVSEHAWGVATLVVYLAGKSTTVPLLIEAIGHDSGEILTGDIPAPAKWAHPKFAQMVNNQEEEYRTLHTTLPPQRLEPWEKHVLKLADMLEGLVFCHRQGKTAAVVESRWFGAIATYVGLHKDAIPMGALTKVNDLLVETGWGELMLDGEEPTSAYVNQG